MSKALNPNLLQGRQTTIANPVNNTFHCTYPVCDNKTFLIDFILLLLIIKYTFQL